MFYYKEFISSLILFFDSFRNSFKDPRRYRNGLTSNVILFVGSLSVILQKWETRKQWLWKKGQEKGLTIFSAARNDLIVHNDMKSNFSPNPNIFVKFFYAYWIIIEFNLRTNFIRII